MARTRRPGGSPLVGVDGAGAVGRRIARLLAPTHRVVSPGVTAPVVVLATGGHHSEAAARWVDHGVSVVSVGGRSEDVRQLLDLDDRARAAGVTVVVGAASSPGLSGMLARYVVDQLDACDELHVAAHGTAGPACAHEHHATLRGWATSRHDGTWVERRSGSGRELCWFPEPVGPWDCYRGDMADGVVLARAFPDVSRISVRRSATRRDRLTARLPMLSPPHRDGGVGALRVEARGRTVDGARLTLVVGVAERVGSIAAATAAAFVEAVTDGDVPTGVVHSGQTALPHRSLLSSVQRHGVRIQEFTGVPQ